MCISVLWIEKMLFECIMDKEYVCKCIMDREDVLKCMDGEDVLECIVDV